MEGLEAEIEYLVVGEKGSLIYDSIMMLRPRISNWTLAMSNTRVRHSQPTRARTLVVGSLGPKKIGIQCITNRQAGSWQTRADKLDKTVPGSSKSFCLRKFVTQHLIR
jgi:hypothetical protein